MCLTLATWPIRGYQSELALLRRHESEKIFGVQIAGGDVAMMSKVLWLTWAPCASQNPLMDDLILAWALAGTVPGLARDPPFSPVSYPLKRHGI